MAPRDCAHFALLEPDGRAKLCIFYYEEAIQGGRLQN